MDYEKKYKEMKARVLEIGRGYVQGVDFSKPRQIAEYIDPELKESEDKKWRNWLIRHLEGYINQTDDKYAEVCKKVISWLESKGEQKSEEWCFPYNVNETVDKLIAIAECLEMDGDCEFNGYTGTECGKFLRDLARKQVECKPADEVEPKFKVGDWVVQDNIGVFKIIEICESWYEVIDFEDNHYSISFDNEHMCHLWTIQDAKDGDVLAFDWKDEWHWQKIVIFKSLSKFGVEGYGNTFKNGKLAFVDEEVPYYSKTWTNTLQPATKEQRDILFAKMKEAGYEWNNEKKELKKIEQTSSWSEEDNKNLNSVKWIIENSENLNKLFETIDSPDYIKKYFIDWLKSLKDRVQPKQEWSEEDERMLTRIINEMEAIKSNSSTILEKNIAQEKIDWIKSLKSHWKPSEEQMNALRWVLNNIPYNKHKEAISKLVDELKSL